MLSRLLCRPFSRGLVGTILGNGRVLTQAGNGDLQLSDGDGAVFYEEDTIKEVSTLAYLRKKYPMAEFLDAKRGLIFPGFVCAHGHFYGMFARGMALKDEAPINFKQILERLWWRLDRALEPEDNYLSAMVPLLQAARCGTTTIIDHHASPTFIEGSLDVIAGATRQVGVRSCLCYEVTDRNGMEGAAKGIEENIRFAKKCYSNGRLVDPLVSATFGLHAPFTVSDETLMRSKKEVEAVNAVSLCRNRIGFHVHVAEDGTDPADSLTRCGRRAVNRLADLGILGPQTITAHCVKVDEAERRILAETGTNVIHNPQSNMNNAVGTAAVLSMMREGVLVGLGTDGMTLDMIAESKVNYLIHKLAMSDPRVMGSETLNMLIRNNSIIASKFFNKKVGVIAPGAHADFAVIKYDPPTPLSAGNLPWHMQFGISSFMVDRTIVGGRVIMEGGRVLGIDEDDIMRRARARAAGVWKRF